MLKCTYCVPSLACCRKGEQRRTGNFSLPLVALTSAMYSCRIVLRYCYQIVINVLFLPKPEQRENWYFAFFCGRLGKELLLFVGQHMRQHCGVSTSHLASLQFWKGILRNLFTKVLTCSSEND